MINKELEFGRCGCGKPNRYGVGKDEYACNKYMRCPTYDELQDIMVMANGELVKLRNEIDKLKKGIAKHKRTLPDEPLEGDIELWNLISISR